VNTLKRCILPNLQSYTWTEKQTYEDVDESSGLHYFSARLTAEQKQVEASMQYNSQNPGTTNQHSFVQL